MLFPFFRNDYSCGRQTNPRPPVPDHSSIIAPPLPADTDEALSRLILRRHKTKQLSLSLSLSLYHCGTTLYSLLD